MSDIEKEIEGLEGVASANGYWQPEKLIDYVPEMYGIIKKLQAELASIKQQLANTRKEVSVEEITAIISGGSPVPSARSKNRAQAIHNLIYKPPSEAK